MITLHLLHPTETTPVQKWNFESEPVIRIGRGDDNHVVLYSSVVSRHHVELRRQPLYWEIVGLGANGTFIEGKQITQARIVHGTTFRLAGSGPRILVLMDAAESAQAFDKTPESPTTEVPNTRTPDPATGRKTFLAPRRDH